MPIKNINQPEFIFVDNYIRLRTVKNDYEFALIWYQDKEIVYNVDGNTEPYDLELLAKMYSYWSNVGECYFIEILEDNVYKPIGDVTLCIDDLPIVIGDKNYHNKGIGRKVVNTLIKRAKKLNFKEVIIEEIYDFNIASIKLFTSIGFIRDKKTEK